MGTDPLRRSRDFRLLWLSAVPAGIGMGAVGLAVFVQAFEITHSPAAVGYLGLVQFVAMSLGVLGGSTIVDHVDRRLLLVLTQVGFGVSAGALLAGSIAGDPPIALLYASSAFGSAVASLHFPTRSAMIPPVVERADLTTAMTLEIVVWNATMIAGPIVGGAILARFGMPAVYGFVVACYGVTVCTMLPLRRQPPGREGVQGRLGVAAIRYGFSYLRSRPVLKGLLWIDLIAMAFGMRRSLFPILALEQFGRGPQAVGLLMAAIPAGALVVSLTGSWLAHVHRQGLGLVLAAVVWGAAMFGFGISGDRLWLALLLLAIGGGADIVAAILRASIIQHEVPAPVRGRVWGINFLALNGGPRLGDLTGGLVASAWSPTFSVVSGGLAALVGVGLYALAVPELPRYTSKDSIDPVEDRPSGPVP
ncbi:MAG: MFS transporter [Actinomycetota bacterium]